MSRLKVYNSCVSKLLELENFLTKKTMYGEYVINASGNDVIISYDVFERRRGGLLNSINKETDIMTINVLESSGAHSIILVKNHFLENKWSIFDANGKKNLPFRIVKDNKDVTQEYLTVTGINPLNYGTDTNNPGYCGTIGIIFMIYFTMNKNNEHWLNNWLNLYEILSTKISEQEGSFAVELSASMQQVISKNPIGQDLVLKLYELIQQYTRDRIDGMGGIVYKPKKKRKTIKYKRKKSSRKKK